VFDYYFFLLEYCFFWSQLTVFFLAGCSFPHAGWILWGFEYVSPFFPPQFCIAYFDPSDTILMNATFLCLPVWIGKSVFWLFFFFFFSFPVLYVCTPSWHTSLLGMSPPFFFSLLYACHTDGMGWPGGAKTYVSIDISGV